MAVGWGGVTYESMIPLSHSLVHENVGVALDDVVDVVQRRARLVIQQEPLVVNLAARRVVTTVGRATMQTHRAQLVMGRDDVTGRVHSQTQLEWIIHKFVDFPALAVEPFEVHQQHSG